MTIERAYMIIAMLILAALALVALNIISEMDKRKLREKIENHIETNTRYYRQIVELTSKNATLIASCEQLANENATLASENARLQACSFGVMMREWKRIEDGERIYYEKDHIRLIVEDDKVVGWYRPEGEESVDLAIPHPSPMATPSPEGRQEELEFRY